MDNTVKTAHTQLPVARSMQVSFSVSTHAYCNNVLSYNRCHPYDHRPSLLIEHLINCINKLKRLEDSNTFVQLLLKYNELLNILLESQTLNGFKQSKLPLINY